MKPEMHYHKERHTKMMSRWHKLYNPKPPRKPMSAGWWILIVMVVIFFVVYGIASWLNYLHGIKD